MEDLIKENMILKMRCRRLVLILNECLSYVDDVDENIKLSNKIEEIKKSLEEDKCKMILDEIIKIGNITDKELLKEEIKKFIDKYRLKRKCGCGKPPQKEDPEIIEYLKSIQN